MNIKLASKILLFTLWLLTSVAALFWVFVPTPPFDPEPVTVVLGLVSTAITGLLSEYSHVLEHEEFSTSYALAYGYVNNFLEPVITNLIKNSPKGETSVVFYIYIPYKLSELGEANISRMMGKIKEKYFSSEIVTLEVQEGRPRDILTVFKNEQEPKIYFDFPTTLLTLDSLINYKIEGKKNHFSDSDKLELGQKYIEKFKISVEKLVAEKDMDEYVRFTNKKFVF